MPCILQDVGGGSFIDSVTIERSALELKQVAADVKFESLIVRKSIHSLTKTRGERFDYHGI